MATDLLRHTIKTGVATLVSQVHLAEVVRHKSLSDFLGQFDRIVCGRAFHDRLLHEKEMPSALPVWRAEQALHEGPPTAVVKNSLSLGVALDAACAHGPLRKRILSIVPFQKLLTNFVRRVFYSEGRVQFV